MNFTQKIVKATNGVSEYNLEGKKFWYGRGNAIIRNNIIIVSGSHARGKTAHIFLVDNDDYIGTIINCPNKTEVYGVIGGQPGWDEVYGWIHLGSWVAVIEKLVDDILLEIEQKEFDSLKMNQEYKKRMQDTLNEKLSKFEDMFSN
jgi:hypothetical protein